MAPQPSSLSTGTSAKPRSGAYAAIARERLVRLQRAYAVPMIVVPAIATAALLPFRLHALHPGHLVLFAVTYFLSMVGITVGYHRLLTHRGFACASWVRGVFAALGASAAQGPPIFWVATHRKHHQCSDATGDPHSPKHPRGGLKGFWHAHVGWMVTEEPADSMRFARDLHDDRAVQWVNRQYQAILLAGVVLPGLVGLAIVPNVWGFVDGALWGGLFRIFAVQHFTWSINSVCHVLGTRRADSGDDSRNNLLLALPTLGESWHANHHAAPACARHGLAWWQIDLSWYVIRCLALVGLAHRVVLTHRRETSPSSSSAHAEDA